MEKTLLNIPETCERLRIGRTRLYQILNAGQLKAVRNGKRTLILSTSIDEFINELNPYKEGQ